MAVYCLFDKIRLHAKGQLPPEYQSNVGDAQPKFNDGRCCRFLGIEYRARNSLILGRDRLRGVPLILLLSNFCVGGRRAEAAEDPAES